VPGKDPTELFQKLTQKEGTEVCVCVLMPNPSYSIDMIMGTNWWRLFTLALTTVWKNTQMFHHPLAGINHDPTPPPGPAIVEAPLIN